MQVVYATSTLVVMTSDGGRHLVQAGQHWPESDPVVQQAPAGTFSLDPRHGLQFSRRPDADAAPEAAPVESATAAPGEKRATVHRG